MHYIKVISRYLPSNIQTVKIKTTRKHSSRMRTTRSPPVCTLVATRCGAGPHVTIIYDALDLTVYSTGHTGPRPGLGFSRHRIWGTPPLLVTTGGHHWRPFQHYSLDLTVQGPPLVLPWGQSD